MSTRTDYITDDEFRGYIKTQSTDSSDVIASAISAASRSIDSYCGRYFYTLDETRYLSACADSYTALWLLPFNDVDLAVTDDLDVRTSTGNDGNYNTIWTLDTDYICEPVNRSQNGIQGWPITSLHAIGTKTWPMRFTPTQRETVKITGTWGWENVPIPVKQATKILAAQLYKMKDAPLGVAGWGAYGDIKVREIPQIAALLAPLRKGNSYGVA